MPERIASSIVNKSGSLFEHLGTMQEGLEWISNNRIEFESILLPALSEVVHKFNRMLNFESIPDDHINLQHFKTNNTRLTRLGEVVHYYANAPEKFTNILNQARQRMVRGDNGERETDYYTFHRFNLTPKQTAVVAMFELADMLYKNVHEFESEHEGQLTCALIEALAEIGQENPLYEIIISPKEANWVWGYEYFDPKFRNRIVGEPILYGDKSQDQ